MKYPVKLETIKLYAQISGDHNPIHQDAEVARKMGLSAPIAHGMFVHNLLMRILDEWITIEKKENRVWKITKTKCRFNGMVPVDKTYQSTFELGELKEGKRKMQLFFLNEAGEKLTNLIANIVLVPD